MELNVDRAGYSFNLGRLLANWTFLAFASGNGGERHRYLRKGYVTTTDIRSVRFRTTSTLRLRV